MIRLTNWDGTQVDEAIQLSSLLLSEAVLEHLGLGLELWIGLGLGLGLELGLPLWFPSLLRLQLRSQLGIEGYARGRVGSD